MAGAQPAPRRDEALAFIIAHLVRTGSAPTLDEIGVGMRPPVSKSRAAALVKELLADGILEKTPGAQRALRVRDVAHARHILVQFARALGYVAAAPLGLMQQPLPMLSPFRHIPDAEPAGDRP